MFFKKLFKREYKPIYGYQHLLKYLKMERVPYSFRGENGDMLRIEYGNLSIAVEIKDEEAVKFIIFLPKNSYSKWELMGLSGELNERKDDEVGHFVAYGEGSVIYEKMFIPTEETTEYEWKQIFSKLGEMHNLYCDGVKQLQNKAVYGFQHLLKFLKEANISYELRGSGCHFFDYGGFTFGSSTEKKESVSLVAFIPQDLLEKNELESLCTILNEEEEGDDGFGVTEKATGTYVKNIVPNEMMKKEEWEQVILKMKEKCILLNSGIKQLHERLHSTSE